MATPPPGSTAPLSVKLFVSQALAAVPSADGFAVQGVPVARVWLQGVVVATSATGEALLDDGSGASACAC